MAKLPIAALLIVAGALSACGTAEPFDYEAYDHRPGLLTGAEGEWVVYRKSDEEVPSKGEENPDASGSEHTIDPSQG